MKLLLIVNGTPIEREYPNDLPIHAVKIDALIESKNTNPAYPPEKWYCCDEAGNRVPDNIMLSHASLPRDRMFVVLEAGVGA